MVTREFDNSIADSQGTSVEPVAVDKFDFESFACHEDDTLSFCRDFCERETGVAVQRRFRAPGVYSYGCRDMQRCLELQLGALAASVDYAADIPNFLEPWYGIGTVASAFGLDYIWAPGQSPATEPPFTTVESALQYEPLSVDRTAIGRHTLDMIEYFLEATGGRLPMSLTDTQSPWNITMMLVQSTLLLLETLEDPQSVVKLVGRVADLLDDFNRCQVELIGDALVCPGHGFASSRVWRSLGMSDDSTLMISPRQYAKLCAPVNTKVGKRFGGSAFHSCGNWSRWIPAVKQIEGLRVVDGAFSPQTDPSPNPPEAFSEAFAGTGITLNARIVGDSDEVARVTRQLWRPGLKLIVVTYCQTPEEQAEAYGRVHEICS